MTLLRYSNEELIHFKTLLENKLQETINEYNAVLWQLTQATLRLNGPESNEEDSLRKDMLYIGAARMKRNLDNLRSALLRIDNKTYGICIVSGTLIPKERLLAVPHTTVNTEVTLYPLRAGA